jgi:hypothetical protein
MFGGRKARAIRSLHMQPHAPTSVILAKLIDDAPKDFVSLDWLLGHLQKRSFGLLLLVLAIVCMVPGIGTVSAFLLAFPATEMILGRESPRLPRFLTARPIPARHFTRWAARALPLLRFIETFSRPRWHTPLQATKRTVGLIVLLLAVAAIWPIPLINVVPALMIVLISLAYLQEDGILLCISIAVALLALALFAAFIWASASRIESIG